MFNPIRHVFLHAWPTLTALALLLLLTLCATLYWPGLNGPFLLDDQHNLNSATVTALELNQLAAASQSNHSGLLGRPISALSFAITQYRYGDSARGFKWHNLLLHLACGLLAFAVTRRIFLALQWPQQKAALAALVATALWLLHPLQVSTTLYAVQRMAQLSTLFSLAALWCYLSARNGGDWVLCKLFIALPTAILLAVFSKENGALVALYLLLIEAVLFGFKAASKSVKLSWLLWIIVPMTFGLLYLALKPSLLNYDFRPYSLTQRLMTQSMVVMQYWQLILKPDPRSMSLFHDGINIAREINLTVAFSIACHSLLVIATLLLKRYRWLLLGVGWFYISHLLESTILPLEMMFEHRNYLALLGVCWLIAGLLNQLRPTGIFVATATIGVLLASGLQQRVNDWSSAERFFSAEFSQQPFSLRAKVGYAGLKIQQGEINQAVELLLQAAQLPQANSGPMLHLVALSCQQAITLQPAFYPLLTQSLRQHPLSPYERIQLHAISNNWKEQRCNNLSAAQFASILTALAEQPLAKEGKMPSLLHLLNARFYSVQNPKQALWHYQQAYTGTSDSGLYWEHASFLLHVEQPQAAAERINALLAKHTLTPAERKQYRAVLDWHQRFTADTP